MDETDRSLAEMVLEKFIGKRMSRGEAQKQTVDFLLPKIPQIREILDAIDAEEQQRVLSKTKLTEVGTSRRRDLKAMGWYTGVDDAAGVWGRLRERMTAGGLADALGEIDKSTEEILASTAEPYVADDKRLGLVIGNVQSGKTANFSAVVSKALDSRYRFVLVLSGVHNNLRKQTQVRLERDLGLADDAEHWYTLTDADGDFGRHETKNAAGIVVKYDRILAVVKKNSTRLHNVLEFLSALDEKTRREIPFLIIDDESDQATPDSSPSAEDEPTKINRLLGQIWDLVGNGTYIGYTATPFANVFMNPNAPTGLYPKDFIHVMPTPKNYFGAERLFGLDGDASERLLPDVIRSIPNAELTELAPKNETPAVTESLASAIRWFIVATAIRRVRRQHTKHSTMLIHTTQRTDPHFTMRAAVRDFLEPLQRAAREGNVESFRETFHSESDRAAELYTGDADAPSWPRISQEIPKVLRALRLSVDNGSASAEERLTYDGGAQTTIVIGGNTLARGMTLEGLFVSFFARTSNAYDTLLQMGRWFGYRPGYEDLQRVWLSPGLDDDYRFLATIEAEVREEVARMTAAGQTPEQIGVRVRLHPGRLQITSPAKMKHVAVAQADFEGFQPQTTRFDASDPRTFSANVAVVRNLRDSIAPFRVATGSDLYTDVPAEELAYFFENFFFEARFGKVFRDAFAWSVEKLPQKRWNVLIPFDDDRDVFRTVDRAPIRMDEALIAESGIIDIRALRRGGDLLADLKALRAIESAATLNNAAQMRMREDRAGLDGCGLLQLYPISRDSIARNPENRMNMRDALSAAGASLSADDAPIIGAALVAPIDTAHELRDKGTRVAVRPIFGEAEDPEGEPILDTEGDFRGGAL